MLNLSKIYIFKKDTLFKDVKRRQNKTKDDQIMLEPNLPCTEWRGAGNIWLLQNKCRNFSINEVFWLGIQKVWQTWSKKHKWEKD